MKNAKIKNIKSIIKNKVSEPIKNIENTDGKHSFLFWLIIPIIMVWLSVGYIAGMINDKPLWSNENKTAQVSSAVPYVRDNSPVSEDLDQPFITLWFDDAWLSQYMVAYPILKKNELVGTIGISTDPIETAGYMNWAQVRMVQKNGWEVTNHSLAHDCTMHTWDRERISYEYKTSKFMLWKNGLSADIFVTPCGVDSSIMREEAEKRFIAYRTVDQGYNDPKSFNPYNLKVKNIDDKHTLSDMKSWVDEAKKSKSWLIIVLHKIGEKHIVPGDDRFNISEENFRKLTDYIKKSGIKVVVPSQIIASQDI